MCFNGRTYVFSRSVLKKTLFKNEVYFLRACHEVYIRRQLDLARLDINLYGMILKPLRKIQSQRHQQYPEYFPKLACDKPVPAHKGPDIKEDLSEGKQGACQAAVPTELTRKSQQEKEKREKTEFYHKNPECLYWWTRWHNAKSINIKTN